MSELTEQSRDPFTPRQPGSVLCPELRIDPEFVQ